MIVNFTLSGVTALLHHKDDVEAADELVKERALLKAEEAKGGKKGQSVAGDDRSPPWTWLTYVYHDGERVALPQDCLMASLKWAATKMPMPGGKGSATMKSVSQSGIFIPTEYCEFTNAGRPVLVADLLKLKPRPFTEQKQGAQKLGFDLLVKRAAVNGKKHVRVRAMFGEWQVSGSLEITDDVITFPILQDMFDLAGNRSGLGDWRPSSKFASGPYGRFTAELKQVTR